MPKRGYHHGNLRQALVDAALELIEEKGPTGFTLSEAAKRAGVTPAAAARGGGSADGALLVAGGKEVHQAWKKEIVPTARFDIGFNLVVKAEAHIINGTGQVYDYNNPDGRDEDWVLYTLKSTLSF